MARFKATIDIYIEAGDRWGDDFDGALADGISGMMELAQQQTHEAGDEFVLIDWSYRPDDSGDHEPSYAKPFDGMTPEEELQASYT